MSKQYTWDFYRADETHLKVIFTIDPLPPRAVNIISVLALIGIDAVEHQEIVDDINRNFFWREDEAAS